MTTSTSVTVGPPPSEDELPPEPERTLRVLVVADLSATADAKVPLPIDREGFDETLRRFAPRFERTGASADPTAADADVQLSFEAWRDFTPAGVAERDSLLAALASVRALAQRVSGGEASADELRSLANERLPANWAAQIGDALASGGEAAVAAPAAAAAAKAPTAATSGDSGVDSLLSMVDAPPAASGAREVADRLVAEVTAGKGSRRKSGAASGPLALCDALIGERLASIVADEGFRRIESIWRGLRFLVHRSDFRAGVRIDCLSAGEDEVASALASLDSLDDYDFVLVAAEFDASARDCERVCALADAASAAQTVVLCALAPAFFGLESWSELGAKASPATLFGGASHTEWRALREDERARSLVLVGNRIALRAGYGPDGEPTRGVAYREPAEAGLFGNAVWGLGSVLVRAFAESGSCIRISGTRHGLISDLALVPEGAAVRGGEPRRAGKPAPVEGAFGRDRIEELESLGIAVVAKYQRDIAFVGNVRTFRKPERYADPEATADSAQQSMLAYQLITTGFVREVSRRLPEFVADGDREALSAGLHHLAIEWFSSEGQPLGADHAAARAEPNAADPSLTDVILRVQPEIVIGNRPLGILLQFSLAL